MCSLCTRRYVDRHIVKSLDCQCQFIIYVHYAWIMCANSVIIKQDTSMKYCNRPLFLSSVIKLVYVRRDISYSF